MKNIKDFNVQPKIQYLLSLSAAWPVDIRNLREMKIGLVCLSGGTGRSWKTSGLTASVHQRAAFRFISIIC